MATEDREKRFDWLIPGHALIDAVCVDDRFLVAYGARYVRGLFHDSIPDSRLYKLDLTTMQQSVSPEKVGHETSPPLRHVRGGFAAIRSMDWDLGAVAYDPVAKDFIVTDATRVCRVDAF